ncbi:biotin/lipoyl-binding protein, partial [Stenotrophomonas maltophilia]
RKTRDFVPSLRTAAVQRVDAPIDLTLPGETQAFARASIFARATGYVAERRVDIGSRVKAGDVLIRIAAPDLDQELAQAE